MSLTTAARVKSSQGIPAGVTFHDVAIGYAVDYANAHVLSAIGQPGGLVGTTRTDYPDIYNASQYRLLLDRSPVISVVGITNAGQALVEGTDYRVDTETGSVRLLQGTVGSRGVVSAWSDIPDDVIITYLHGYTSGTVDARLVRAADMIAAHNFQQIKNAGHKRVRNSSYAFDMNLLSVPMLASNILAEFTDVHHT